MERTSGKSEPRETARERKAREEWEARNELDPTMLPAWERIGGQFKGSPQKRVEAFLEWAEENAGELAAMTYGSEESDAELAASYEAWARAS
jgi:hypothetical protein